MRGFAVVIVAAFFGFSAVASASVTAQTLTASAQSSVQSSVATLVVCGANDPSGMAEIQRMNDTLQLVVKSSYLIGEFMQLGFINRGNLTNGELIVPVDSASPMDSSEGHIGNRHFGFYADGGGGYILTIRYIDADGELGRVLANFHFIEGCQMYSHTQQL